MWAEWLHNPCFLGGSQHGDKNGLCRADGKMTLRVALNTKKGWKLNWLHHSCHLGDPHEGKMATPPLPPQEPPKRGWKSNGAICFFLGTGFIYFLHSRDTSLKLGSSTH